MGWMLLAFILKTFEDGLGNFAVRICVGIIQEIVCRSLVINIKLFEVVEVEGFLLKL